MSWAAISYLLETGALGSIAKDLGIFGYYSGDNVQKVMTQDTSMRKNKPMAVPRSIPKGENRSRIPVGEANPMPTPPRTPKRPAPDAKGGTKKKQKVSGDMVKVKNEVMSGDKDTIKTNYSYVKLFKKQSKVPKMVTKGVFTHVHNYADKITSDFSGVQVVYSGKPTVGFENFATANLATGITARSALTNLNCQVVNLSPTTVTHNQQVDGDAAVATTPVVEETIADRNYFYVKSQLVSVHLKNMYNLPCRITCYWVTPKKITRNTPTEDLFFSDPTRPEISGIAAQTNISLGTTFGDGIFGNLGNLSGRNKVRMEAWRGYKPTDFVEFKKRWKIIKKDIINLPSGGLMIHNVKFDYNKYFSQKYADSGILESPANLEEQGNTDALQYPGASIVPMFVCEGFLSQADEEDEFNLPTFGNVDVNIGFEVKTKVNWVTNNVNVPKTTFRARTLIGATKTQEEFINMIDADANGDPAD